MRSTNFLLQQLLSASRQELRASPPFLRTWRSSRCPQCLRRQQRRFQHNPADDPSFQSVVDRPAVLVRSGKKHGPGLIILALIPITAFALGTWQVQRLGWKTDLLAKLEDRILRDPLPLPPVVDPTVIPSFDYRRIIATGRFRHDLEMLIGPRLHDGSDGYLVITPLERPAGSPNPEYTVLVNRGWIPKEKKDHSKRSAEALPEGEVMVEGLLRQPWKRNMFTPVNKPDEGKWYFPDVLEMAKWVGCQPVWVEETMDVDLLQIYDRETKGMPIGRPAEVNLRNNHLQYIFTWYSLCLATSVMFYLVIRKPPSQIAQRVRQSKEWS